jgi:hypothetical protein
LGKREKNLPALAEASGIPASKSWKDFTLVDVLQVCSHGLKGSRDADAVGTDWRRLTNVRNAVMHNKTDELQDWQGIVKIVLDHWKRVTSLIRLIEAETHVPFTGLYQEEAQTGETFS